MTGVSFILYNNNNIGWLYFGLYENILNDIQLSFRLVGYHSWRVLYYSHITLNAIQYYIDIDSF